MNELDHCYLEALSEALKGNLGEALELRNEADALASEGFAFSENYGNKYPFIEEAVNTLLGSFDFTRCVRADGSAYGTRGKCKKGTEQSSAKGPNSIYGDIHETILRGLEKQSSVKVPTSVLKARIRRLEKAMDDTYSTTEQERISTAIRKLKKTIDEAG